MDTTRLTVIVPTHNRADLLRRCLRALERQSAPRDRFEVVVVDDGSTDATRSVLKQEQYELPLQSFFLPHGGANRARNHGAAAARGELLLFLGDDMLADPELVSAHLRAHTAHTEEHVGIFGHVAWAPDLARTPFLDYLGEPDCSYQFGFAGFDPGDVPLGHMYGSHHSVKRAWFNRHGGFDEAFTLSAFDDIELECRYRQSGFRLVYQPEARLCHYHPYDLESFCRRMRMVGRAAVQLHQKHPGSVVVTRIGTLLTLRVTEDQLDQKVRRLQEEEQRLCGLALGSQGYREEYAGLRTAWREVLDEASALGAQEGAHEAGWTDLRALLRGHTGCGEGPVRKRLSIFLGTQPRQLGLELLHADCRCEAAEDGGREAIRLHRSPSGGHYLYLRADDRFVSRYGSPLTVTVEYLDRGKYEWLVQYDSADTAFRIGPEPPGAFKSSAEVVTNEDTGQWRRARFRLDDCLFLGRCHGADFRIAAPPGSLPELCVSKVEVEPAEQEASSNWPEIHESVARRPVHTDPEPVDFPEESAPEVSIIIPVCGLVAYTAGCLRAVRETADGRYELIVVDNGSPDETLAYLARCAGVRVVPLGQNFGFAAACNQGAGIARGDLLVFLNNDTVPLPGWLAALRADLHGVQDAGIVGAKLLYPRGHVQHAGLQFHQGRLPYHACLGYPPHHPEVSRTRAVEAVTGACILVRRSDFEAVRGFDERYHNGYEDVDLCLKLARRGRRAVYSAESVLYHFTSMTPGRHDWDGENYRLFLRVWEPELPGLLARAAQPLTSIDPRPPAPSIRGDLLQ